MILEKSCAADLTLSRNVLHNTTAPPENSSDAGTRGETESAIRVVSLGKSTLHASVPSLSIATYFE